MDSISIIGIFGVVLLTYGDASWRGYLCWGLVLFAAFIISDLTNREEMD